MSCASLYVNRSLLNAADVIEWYKRQGLRQTLPADDMHVTIAYSTAPLDWRTLTRNKANLRVPLSRRDMRRFDKGALVLRFESPVLSLRWQQFRDAGASWDHPGYEPHITITYSAPSIDPAVLQPFPGALEFGPERLTRATKQN